MYPVKVVRRRGAKRLTLSRTSRGIVLTAPKYAPKALINSFINRHNKWIAKYKVAPLRSWNGYEISYKKGSNSSTINANKITISHSCDCFDCDKVQSRAKKYLFSKAKQDLTAKILEYAEKHSKALGVSFNKITIKDMSTRWGSCSSKGNLNFSIYLAPVHDRLIEYVVVHELCHIIHPNHSAKFWNQVNDLLPDYKQRITELKKHRTSI